MNWHPQAYQVLLENNYPQVCQFYEGLIESGTDNIANYWYLGLSYLLQEKEEEAQATWLLAMSEGNEEEVEEWTEELIEILETEAQRQNERENYQLTWLIRGYIREIDPSRLNNLLSLVLLEIKLNYFQPAKLEELRIGESLQATPKEDIEQNLLLEVLKESLSFLSTETVNLFKVAIPLLDPEQEISEPTVLIAIKTEQKEHFDQVTKILELILEQYPNDLYLLQSLCWLYKKPGYYSQSLEKAGKFLDCSNTSILKLYGSYLAINTKLRMGNWLELEQDLQDYKQIIQRNLDSFPQFLEYLVLGHLVFLTECLIYLEDNPLTTHTLRKQLGRLFQEQYRTQAELTLNPLPRIPQKTLKIGYLSQSLRRHSIGWLSRWLLHYHDQEKFDIILYLHNQTEDSLTRNWFRKNAKFTYNLESDPIAIAQKIHEDEINILIDLESSTSDTTCQVLALKPAPVQVTWLGFDASGIPAIDYFIADPYVLPENAQDYYQEKIWRLPKTFLAVDGSEIDVPTLRREHLDIPADATIYLTAQTGLKRHPDTIRLQMKILKQVPNSYFLIQGLAEQAEIKNLFTQIAESEGVSSNKLRFLPMYPTEIYRANLAIADVVLDTYPFNGGTTTVDILWREIPVVTKVGQQWASRLGYSLLTNAGITEGIGWDDEEYVDWGIRLGTDEQLRKEVTWKLRQGKKSASLWNAKAFTQEMEKAYQQMWEIYCQGK